MLEKELVEFIKASYPHENESCEWKAYSSLKHSVNGHPGDDIVSYISGISNMEGGTLIIGVKDKTGEIVGIRDFSSYTPESIKSRIMDQMISLPSEGFWVEPKQTSDSMQVIWIFHIPRHLPRKVVFAHHKAWQRAGDSLIPLTIERDESITIEPLLLPRDWSAEIVPNATIEDLSPNAIAKARQMYLVKNPRLKAEIESWDDITFLNNAKVTIKNKITNTAIILLGKSESETLIAPCQAKIMWVLKAKDNSDKDYQSFSCPMIESVDLVFNKIRNLRYRYMNDSSIFPEEMDLYEPALIREALHNCIAHQDYQMGGRINVVENEDSYLIFSNCGVFLPGSIETVLYAGTPPELYRNPFLANAMVSLNMIDTLGGGIRRMYEAQRKRLFPMPEYDIANNRVEVRIIGKVIDDAFAKLLIKHADLSIREIYLLDKVQKNKPISDEEARELKKKKYIEGRKPHFFLSKPLSDVTEQKMRYTKNRGFKKQQYKEMVLKALEEHTVLTRKEIDDLLLDMLSPLLSFEQKTTCIGNYISELRASGLIINTGSKRYPRWKKE